MGEHSSEFMCGGNKRFNAHDGATFRAKQRVDLVNALNGSASSPQESIAQVFDIVFLSGISEMVLVSTEQHSLRLN